MDGRTLGRFLALGPIVVGAECALAHALGWTHATVLTSWRGVALALACWEWSGLVWMHGWLKSGGPQRLLQRAPDSRLARFLARRRD
jgi:hypothetical protein